MFGVMVGMGRGLSALQTLLIIKKCTSHFSFQSNELFLKFPRRQMAISKFLSDAFQENTRCGDGGIHNPITFNLKKSIKPLIANPMSSLRILVIWVLTLPSL